MHTLMRFQPQIDENQQKSRKKKIREWPDCREERYFFGDNSRNLGSIYIETEQTHQSFTDRGTPRKKRPKKKKLFKISYSGWENWVYGENQRDGFWVEEDKRAMRRALLCSLESQRERDFNGAEAYETVMEFKQSTTMEASYHECSFQSSNAPLSELSLLISLSLSLWLIKKSGRERNAPVGLLL